MRTTIRYVLLCAIRDKLFMGLCAAIVLSALLAHVIGSTAFLEEEAMTIVLAAAAARVILVVGLIVFICFHLQRAFESREIEMLLSRPLSRGSIVLSYAAGFAVVAFLLALPAAAIAAYFSQIHGAGLALWTVSLFLEAVIISCFALFSAFILKSAVSAVLASLGMYLLSRMMIYFLMTLKNGSMHGDFSWLAYALDYLSYLIPRLDLFAKSEWLVYGNVTTQDWTIVGLQSVLYIVILLMGAISDFRRRQF